MRYLLNFLIPLNLNQSKNEMTMIKLAVVGTNWITDQFIEGALKTGCYELAAVYSRNIESASAFVGFGCRWMWQRDF